MPIRLKTHWLATRMASQDGKEVKEMAEILDMQTPYEETPDEHKASVISVGFCHKSYASIAFCGAK